MAFNTLPDELVVYIFQEVKSSYDLSKLALCSKRCNSLVLSVLYSSFGGEYALLRTPPFLSTIARRPQLARYVKTLSYGERHLALFPKLVKDWFNKIQNEINAALSRVCGGDDDLVREWYDDLHHSVDAITALVIIFLPNLSTLNLPRYPFLNDPVYPEYTPMVLSQASQSPNFDITSPCRMNELRNLNVGSYYAGELSWNFVRPLLQLKSLRYLHCYGVCLGDQDINSMQKITSHITHFRLEIYSSTPAALVQLLKSCPNLTRFSCIHLNGSAFESATMKAGLMHLKDSLQELMLLSVDEEIGIFHLQDVLLPLGSLAGFRKLQRVHASMRTLLGHEVAEAIPGTFETGNGESNSGTLQPLREQAVNFVESLPETLQELVIECCVDSVYAVLSVLFESIRNGKLQNLTTVKLHRGQRQRLRGMDIDKKEAIRCAEEGKALGILVEETYCDGCHS